MISDSGNVKRVMYILRLSKIMWHKNIIKSSLIEYTKCIKAIMVNYVMMNK